MRLPSDCPAARFRWAGREYVETIAPYLLEGWAYGRGLVYVERFAWGIPDKQVTPLTRAARDVIACVS